MDNNVNILISKEEIEEKICELGKVITKDYAGKNIYVLSLLNGSFIYTADLVRHLDLNASSVKSCVLLDKPDRRKVAIIPDYCCFKIPDVFVAGYGLNYGDFYRNIPYIFNFKK